MNGAKYQDISGFRDAAAPRSGPSDRVGLNVEIHAPDHPIGSWRDIALHLGIVTMGILIALGLDALVESHRHQQLADEARANIRAEIRDNLKELDFFIKTLPESEKDVRNGVVAVSGFMKHRDAHYSMTLQVHGSDLSEASWETAQSVGAFAFMPYDEVKRYGAVYDFQRFLVSQQRQAFTLVGTALMRMSAPDTTDEDLRRERENLLELAGQMTLLEQTAPQLKTRYEETLKEKG